MTARAEAIKLIEYVPDSEMGILLEVIRHFIPDQDDVATPEDIADCEQAMREDRAGETIPHESIDWG